MVACSRTRRRCGDRLDLRRQPRRPPSASDGARSRRLRTRGDRRAAPSALIIRTGVARSSVLVDPPRKAAALDRGEEGVPERLDAIERSIDLNRTPSLPRAKLIEHRARVIREQLKLDEATGREDRAESKGRRDTRTERSDPLLAVEHESEPDVADMDEVVLIEAQVGGRRGRQQCQGIAASNDRAPAPSIRPAASSSSRRVLMVAIAAAGSTDVAYHVR